MPKNKMPAKSIIDEIAEQARLIKERAIKKAQTAEQIAEIEAILAEAEIE